MHYAQLISFYYPLDISPNSDYNISSTILDLLCSYKYDFGLALYDRKFSHLYNCINGGNYGFYCTYQQIFKRIQSHI